ncbi:MAG TPA: flavodoxin family protein [Candidatus Brocadiia bacterium]|nr:flavodoxin family protein [Candidatus Brocadiia bacterium]
MKALAICGSPRPSGNTEALLRRCLDSLQKTGIETELVPLAGKRIRTCIACGRCGQTQDKTCALKDDDFHPIFNKMLQAGVLIVGSPVYFGSATPETMALLDRAGYVSRANGGLFARKIGGPVTVARRAGQNFTFAQLLFWFTINDMIVPGSTYWNIAVGREPGAALQDAEALKTLDRFAENIAWLAQRLCAKA